MLKGIFTALAISFMGASLSGCILAAAGAGYLVADEIQEGDGKMDPLEKVRNKENEAN